jgi:hypothetical protein
MTTNVYHQNSNVKVEDVYQCHGNAMEQMTAKTILMKENVVSMLIEEEWTPIIQAS